MIEIKKFSAPWCGPCRQLSPLFTTLKEKHKSINFIDVDVDENETEALSLKVRSIPTIIVFKDNVEIDRMIGVESFSYYDTYFTNLEK